MMDKNEIYSDSEIPLDESTSDETSSPSQISQSAPSGLGAGVTAISSFAVALAEESMVVWP